MLGASMEAAVTNAWQRTDKYAPPDFNGFFPDDSEGGQRLDAMATSGQLERLPAEEMVPVVQRGLRAMRGRRLGVLRSLGNRFIWGQPDQNPAAIELMYHAAGCPPAPGLEEIAQNGVYFGLSVVKTKSPNVLRTLVDLCVSSNDPNILERVAWGIRSQMDEGLAFLQPQLASQDGAIKAKAEIVASILTGKIKAFDWAREETRKRAESEYRNELPAIKRALAEGDSRERRQTIEKIYRGGITLIMDDSFIEAFANCARDVDDSVRKNTARLVGGQWLWSAKIQNPQAIQLLLDMTRDPNREVRYDAVYHGLSTVREKSDAVRRRLVELYLKDNDPNLRQRVAWSFSQHDRNAPEKLTDILAEYLTDPDPQVVQTAAEWLQHWTSNSPTPGTRNSAPAQSLGTNTWHEIRQRLTREFRPFVIRLVDGQRLLLTQRETLALGDQVLVIVEPHDRVRTLDCRQITGLDDLPKPQEKK